MDGDADPFFIGISVSHFSIVTHEFSCLNKINSLLSSQLVHQQTLHILNQHYLGKFDMLSISCLAVN